MLRPFSPLTAMPSSSFSPSSKPKRNPNSNPNSPSPNPNFTSMSQCNHSPSATLDVIILVLVLFSCAFLIISSFAHLARTLSLLLPPLLRPLAASFYASPLPYLAAVLLLLLAALIAAAELSCSARSWWPFWPRRRCGNPRCRGLRKALEFDVQLQTEEALRSAPDDAAVAAMWKEIDGLPWKGGQQGNNPDYECLRAELRRLAPPNGRAVLLFRSRCGCPIAKLEGWGPKRSRRNKKGGASLALEGGER